MSKCDLRIQFDSPDRTVRGGDPVTGKVFVQVNEDIRCRKITLTYYWKIHGRGNTHAPKKPPIDLCEGTMLMAGEELEFPFEFEADRWPPTLHGHYINADHYVHVGVDVPWSFDPKLDEDFIVLPGLRPDDLPDTRGEMAVLNRGVGSLSGPAKYLIYGVLAVLAVPLIALSIFLLPVILAVTAGVWFWKKAVEGRVGEVELTVPHVIIHPGEDWKVKLKFTPKKSFAVNGIFVRLKAAESATAGSGTNATTYRHTVFDEVFPILPACQLEANQPVDEELTISVPTDPIFSIDMPSNKITWDAIARIDIPRFPDWSRTTKLQLLPAAFFGDEGSFPTSDDLGHQSAGAINSEHRSGTAMDRQPGSTLESAQNSSAKAQDQGLEPLVKLLNAIAGSDRYGSEREEILTAAHGETVDVTVVIDRLNSTLDETGNDARFVGGKTIVGQVRGTDHLIELFTVVGSNDLLDGLDRGDPWQTLATVTEWDSLHNRLVLHEVPFDE